MVLIIIKFTCLSQRFFLLLDALLGAKIVYFSESTKLFLCTFSVLTQRGYLFIERVVCSYEEASRSCGEAFRSYGEAVRSCGEAVRSCGEPVCFCVETISD